MCEIMEMLQNLPFPIETILGGGGGAGGRAGGSEAKNDLYNVQYIIQYIFCNPPHWNPQTCSYGQAFPS